MASETPPTLAASALHHPEDVPPGVIPRANPSKRAAPADCLGRGRHTWGGITSPAMPTSEAWPLPRTGVLHRPTHGEQTPLTRPGATPFPGAPGRRQCAHPPRGLTPHPTRLRSGGCSPLGLPAPAPHVPPVPPGRAAPPRAPRAGSPIPPPRAPPSGTFRPPRGGSRRPSGARAAPLGRGGGRPGGPTRGAGREGGPAPLPAAAPLSAAQAASEVTAPASALSASSGTSSSMAARADRPDGGRPEAAPELRPPPPNNNRRRLEGGGRGPGPGNGGRARGRGQRAPACSERAQPAGTGAVVGGVAERGACVHPRVSSAPTRPGGGRTAPRASSDPVAGTVTRHKPKHRLQLTNYLPSERP